MTPLLFALLALQAPADTVALVDVAILDVVAGRIVPGQTVIIGGDEIVAVGPVGEVSIPASASVVSGQGKTILPGLIDSHVHADSVDLPLFLANGVTAIRELNASPRHLAWRDAIAAGRLAGPTMLVSSALLAGDPMRFRHERVTSADSARVLVRRLAAAGYDFAKIYDGLSRAVYAAIVATSDAVGLPYTGHVPSSVGLESVLRTGQAIEHAEQFVISVLGHGLEDTGRLDDAVRSIAATSASVTPTLAVHEVLNGQHLPGFSARFEAPELQFVDSTTMAWWSSLGRSGGYQSVDGELWPERYLRLQREVIGKLHRLGVPLLLGTDTPNPLMVPGFSVHDELEALVRAGLPPIDAIRAATAVPGRLLPFARPTGQVAVGFAADLVVVAGNPLEDLSVLRTPDLVIIRGALLPNDALQAMLDAHPRRN